MKKALCQKVLNKMLVKDMDLTHLAYHCKVDISTVSKWFNSNVTPTKVNMQKIKQFLKSED